MYSFISVVLLLLRMDFGEAKFILSKKLNRQLLIVSSKRQVGFAYKFHKKNDNQYSCASCKKLGKSRVVTVKDERIVGKLTIYLIFRIKLVVIVRLLGTCYKLGIFFKRLFVL
jgi:hypothetical protein